MSSCLPINLATIGKNIPNTPMLAAVVKASGVMGEEEFLGNMEASLRHKFATKPEVIESNMEALRVSLKEVKLYER